MRYTLLSAALIPVLLVAVSAQAAIKQCGDGNQLYTQAKHGDTVRYFASINEFEVTRISETQVEVEDNVDCRYGTDKLENIGTIEFLDSTVDTDELVMHNNVKNLSRSVIQSILSSRLAEQIRALGGNPDAPASNEPTFTQNNSTPNYSTYSGGGSSSFSLSNSTQTSSNTTNTSPYSTYSGSRYSTYGSSNTNPYTSSYSNTNTTYTNPYTSSYATYNTSNTGSPYANSNWYSNYQSQNSAGTLNVEWNGAGASGTVYIEVVTDNGQRFYLGSAQAGVSSTQVQIPRNLSGLGQATVYVRNGTRVINSYTINF